ncbi:unnamed protein product, partial [marine sediment metagenome]
MSWSIASGSDGYSISAAPLKPASSNSSPNTPTITNYNTGAWTSDNTPALNFTQDDPDSGEQVKYQIQIDGTDNTFANLVVDYTSDFMAEGATSFTVGQAAGSGSYSTGSQGQTLSDGNYYWRVKSIDDDTAESGWATANSGSIAFKVDATEPTAPGDLTESSKTSSSITLSFGSQSTETNFDTYKIFYKQGASGVTESDTEHSDSDLGYIDYNSTTTTTISGLSASTQYVFNIWAYDLVGNKASATEVAITTDAAGCGSNARVCDTFTESSDTDLTSHTPDIGTGWTKVYDNTTDQTDAQITAVTDIVVATTSELSKGQTYTAQPAPSSVDQDISVTIKALEPDSGTIACGIFGRMADTENYYAVRILPNDHATSNSVELWKFQNNAATSLGSYDATLAVGTVIKLEIWDAHKKVYIDGVERISSTNNDLTAAGTWGIFWGYFD